MDAAEILEARKQNKISKKVAHTNIKNFFKYLGVDEDILELAGKKPGDSILITRGDTRLFIMPFGKGIKNNEQLKSFYFRFTKKKRRITIFYFGWFWVAETERKPLEN